MKSDQGDEDKQQTRTLMRELLDQYEDMKKNGSQLPSRKAARITSRTIGSTLMIIITTNTVYLRCDNYYYYAGNKSKLPQVVRRGKISKKRDLDRTEAFIAEEEKDDLALFEEINVLKSCCSRCDSSTNCIKKAFTAGPSRNFDQAFD